MSDSECSDIDVCSIDEATAANLHNGLTLVAAETYVSTNSTEGIDETIPLTEDDLLTKNKTKKLNLVEPLGKMVKSSCKSMENLKDSIGIKELKNSDSKIPISTCSVEVNKLKNIDNETRLKNETIEILNNVTIEITSMDGSDEDEYRNDSEDELFDTGVDNMLSQFYFESDHLAIKNNKDYHNLLQTLAILEAQRVQAIRDLEELHRLKSEALAAPLTFVKNLQEKKLPELPTKQPVANLPEINWVHYMAAYSGDRFVPQITTRKSMKFQEKDDAFTSFDSDLFDDNSLESLSSDTISNKTKIFSNKVDNKPLTFKLKWTTEEQEKLEKLLVLYPPEEVEQRRWEKIAKALGNRTPQQFHCIGMAPFLVLTREKMVSSRIQKYFLKLAKAKLPIPGRLPTASSLTQSKKVKMNLVNYKNSTFFPSWRPNVFMKEEDYDEESNFSSFANGDIQVSDDDMIADEMKDSPEYCELMELKKMKKLLLEKRQSTQGGPVCHAGFMCDGCNMDPIVGVRWHCKDCPQQHSIDFCNNCAQRNLTSKTHTKDHQLLPIHDNTEVLLDSDYLTFTQANKFRYNYLDPNFLPTNKNS